MDGVTDSVFRHIVATYGKPDVVFTEFTNVHDICSGRIQALDSLLYSNLEHPVIAQIYGKDPFLFYQAAHIICDLGFKGLDINMGCPSKNVANSGSGAGLIRTPNLALDLMVHARKGIQDWTEGQSLTELGLKTSVLQAIAQLKAQHPELTKREQREPIALSVKTRLGYDRNIIDEWSDCLIQGRPEVIAIHGRTLSQMYRGQSDWEAIAQAATRIRTHGILTLGNGDIKTLEEAHQRIKESDINGVLIGRAALGNPWMFQGIRSVRDAIGRKLPLPPTKVIPGLNEKFQVDDRTCQVIRNHLWERALSPNAKTFRLVLFKFSPCRHSTRPNGPNEQEPGRHRHPQYLPESSFSGRNSGFSGHIRLSNLYSCRSCKYYWLQPRHVAASYSNYWEFLFTSSPQPAKK